MYAWGGGGDKDSVHTNTRALPIRGGNALSFENVARSIIFTHDKPITFLHCLLNDGRVLALIMLSPDEGERSFDIVLSVIINYVLIEFLWLNLFG